MQRTQRKWVYGDYTGICNGTCSFENSFSTPSNPSFSISFAVLLYTTFESAKSKLHYCSSHHFQRRFSIKWGLMTFSPHGLLHSKQLLRSTMCINLCILPIQRGYLSPRVKQEILPHTTYHSSPVPFSTSLDTMFSFHNPNGLRNLPEAIPLPQLLQSILPPLPTSFATCVNPSVFLLSFLILYHFTGLLTSLLFLLCMLYCMPKAFRPFLTCQHCETTSCDSTDESRDERMEQPSPQPRRSPRLLRRYKANVGEARNMTEAKPQISKWD